MNNLDDILSQIDDIHNNIISDVENSLRQIRDILNAKLEEFKRKAAGYYYKGYEPLSYRRQWLLPGGIETEAYYRNQSDVYVVGWAIEPTGRGIRHTKYGKHAIPPDENKIWKNFLAGIHPNAGGTNPHTGSNPDLVDERYRQMVSSLFSEEYLGDVFYDPTFISEYNAIDIENYVERYLSSVTAKYLEEEFPQVVERYL